MCPLWRGDVGGPYDVSGESTEAEKEGREGGTRRGAYPLRSHFNLKLLCNEQRARRASSWLSRLDLLQSHFNFQLSFPIEGFTSASVRMCATDVVITSDELI